MVAELSRDAMLGRPTPEQRASWWSAIRAVRLDRLLAWNALFAGWLCLLCFLFGKWLVVAAIMAVWGALPWN